MQAASMIPFGCIKLCRRSQDPTTGTPDSRITAILLAYSQIHPSLSPMKIYNPMHYYYMWFRCGNKILRRSNPTHNFQVLQLMWSSLTSKQRFSLLTCQAGPKINLSQTMARVIITTIQNGQQKITVFRKNQFIILKMLRLTIEIITHLQENKYMKSPKSAIFPQWI